MKDIFPVFDQLISREEKEQLLGQRGKVLWLFGPSGSGKTTLALALEKKLHAQGRYTLILDGDNLRSGLNAGLGFSTEDRMENIRRAAEIAKILVQNGVIVIGCFVCPLQSMRALARAIIGPDYTEIYVRTALETLIQRDTKGLYQKAREGKIDNLTGVNAAFEEGKDSELLIDTDTTDVQTAVEQILGLVSS